MDRTIGAQLIRPDRPIYTRSGWEIPQVTKLPRDIKLNAIRAGDEGLETQSDP